MSVRGVAMGLCLLAGCHRSEQPVSVRSGGSPEEAPVAVGKPSAEAGEAANPEDDLPFPDAGLCTLARKYFALPPSDGRCDAQRCAAAGGLCAYGGIGCIDVCSRRTRDAGKVCRDRSECEGGCYADKDAPRGKPSAGTCSATLIDRGCNNPVVKGIAQGGICAD